MVVNFESAKRVNCVRFMQATTNHYKSTRAHTIFNGSVTECKRKIKNIEAKNYPSS